MKYNIIFYEKKNGESELWNFLEKLRSKSTSDKDARIQYKQITLYIELLQNNGTHLPDTITKHLEEDIWELRPGNNRIFYFYNDNGCFVLLHSFRKKRKKLRVERLLRQKPNATTTYPERSINHENLE